MRIVTSFEMPAVTRSWFADFCSALDLRLHDFAIPSKIHITRWTPDEFEATQTEDDAATTLKVVRDPFNGVSTANISGNVATGPRATRSSYTASFDSPRWFGGEKNAISAQVTNPFGVAQLSVSATSANSPWVVTSVLVLRGRGLLRPLTTLALGLVARRLRKSLERSLKGLGTRITTEVQAAQSEGPDAAAQRALEAFFVPPGSIQT